MRDHHLLDEFTKTFKVANIQLQKTIHLLHNTFHIPVKSYLLVRMFVFTENLVVTPITSRIEEKSLYILSTLL